MAGSEVPARVAALAERYRLGAFVDGVKALHPALECAAAVTLAAVAFGAAWVVDRLLRFVPVRPLALVVAALALAGIGLVGYGLFRLFHGSGAAYRFAGGVVWTRHRRMGVAAWTAVDEMRVSRKGATVTRAGMITFDGRRIRIECDDPARFTAFVDAVERVVRDHRRPVLDAHRFDDAEPPGVPLGDRAIAVVDLVVGAGLVVAVGVSLFAAGLPGPVTAMIGLVVVGVVQVVVGIRFDRRIAAHGLILLVVAGLMAMVGAARALPDLDPYAVATAVLAIEVAVLSLGLALYRRLPARRPTRYRRRVAASHHWRYAGTHTIPVAGPHTARQLIGVPEGSTTTTLTDVLIGSIGGVPVLIGDRARRRPRTGDPVQTVWLVALPHGTAPTHGRTPPTGWIENGYLYVTGHADRDTTLRYAATAAGYAVSLP